MKQKVAMVLPYLQKAGLVSEPPPCDIAPKLTRILEAAADRVKVAGDILDFTEFFISSDAMTYDEKAVEKRLRKPDDAVTLLKAYRDALAAQESFDAESLDKHLHDFVEAHEIKIGQIIHAIRVGVTGKAVGIGMFDTLEILGKETSLERIDRTLAHVTA